MNYILIEDDSFVPLREQIDRQLELTLRDMEAKEAEEGQVTVKINIRLTARENELGKLAKCAEIGFETSRTIKFRWSAKGTVTTQEMQLGWDERRGLPVLRPMDEAQVGFEEDGRG